MEIADLERVIEIDQRSFSLPWPVSSFQYELSKNKASRSWVAELEQDSGRRVVGMAVAWLIVDEVHIATIAVLPEVRRKKIGQKLLSALLEDAVSSGAKAAFLEVRDSNVAARQMYRKFGFMEVSRSPHYYSDNQEDAILMNLDPINLQVIKALE
jgi:ribosomal-protein-alanine N-acetyltransferase